MFICYVDNYENIVDILSILNISPGPVCTAENVLNFTRSGSVTTSADTACLACLFNGVSPQPGTMWSVNGQLVDSMEQFAQVNANGTLVIRRPPGFTGEVMFSCQIGLSVYNITVISELDTFKINLGVSSLAILYMQYQL